ncbi:Ctr copper transporter family-domain-containing protein [Hypoxylon rubiginosum]|uniref:Ctr copper transporter family-domain-containing protein n=1 Tax=Hypoxylon rubiginosum TaxID=110542 RepID=A0ACC0CQ24_9PEZI|nr:Ctr copper transporter family-domain-containing protein [Hypoxylon rubiginosum]
MDTSMSDMTMSMSATSTTMDMASSTATSAAAATTSSMSMGGMGGMDMSSPCKISMLWNWNTIDACFISSSWHIRSRGMFAGSCIGVILLGILLECLRRGAKEYDSFLVRKNALDGLVAPARSNEANEDGGSSSKMAPRATTDSVSHTGYRPKIWEQAIRALLHTAQFVVAYFLMLLAMYYNGYFIICIFIGAFIGSFIFQWEKLGGGRQTGVANEPTVCCG